MLRTISVGEYLQIQGLFVRTLENGKIVVSVGNRQYEGRPVTRVN